MRRQEVRKEKGGVGKWEKKEEGAERKGEKVKDEETTRKHH